MKKITKTLSILLCIAILFAFTGCLKETEGTKNESAGNSQTGSAPGGESGGTYGGESGGTTALPTRLSSDGVDYLVNNGKLLISGSGTVTKEAIASISPEYNEIDFETGTFDIGDDAFNGYKDIIKVQFRDNVHNIGAGAFRGTSLPLICFGTSIESIGDKAFADCCINFVLINNENMFKNFNSRYDFGEVAITANSILVYQDFISTNSKDFTEYNDIAGDYLAASGLFDELERRVQGQATVTSRKYQFRVTSNKDEKTGFIPIYGTSFERLAEMNVSSYNANTNVLDYYFTDDELWQGRGVVMYDGNKNSDSSGETSDNNSVDTSRVLSDGDSEGGSEGPTDIDWSRVVSDDNPDGNSGKVSGVTTDGNPPTPPKKYECTCSTCNGSGKKDCGSCDGGYIIGYETGTYMGYGSPTSEVSKRCKLCGGQGTVKCTCCPTH